MGLSKYISNKLKEKVGDYKAERAHQRVERLEERNEYEKGRREGSFKRGQLEGAGGLTEKEKYYSRQPRGGRSRSGGVQRTTGRGGFVATGNAIFGGGMGGIGSGIGFGLGDEPRRSTGPPMRTRTISPSGKVTIQEPIERRSTHEDDGGMAGLGLGIDSFGFGGSSGGKKGKRKPHPYEF